MTETGLVSRSDILLPELFAIQIRMIFSYCLLFGLSCFIVCNININHQKILLLNNLIVVICRIWAARRQTQFRVITDKHFRLFRQFRHHCMNRFLQLFTRHLHTCVENQRDMRRVQFLFSAATRKAGDVFRRYVSRHISNVMAAWDNSNSRACPSANSQWACAA